MENAANIIEAAKGLVTNQRFIIKSLIETSRPIQFFDSIKSVIPQLQDRGIIEIKREEVFLTNLGKTILECWQNQKLNKLQKPLKESSKSNRVRQNKLERSNEFLELYKQGLSYQDIGEKYNLSRERVRQILKYNNIDFNKFLQEREEAKANTEKEKEERAKQELFSRSIAALYPEKILELWDYTKNDAVHPDSVVAGSTSQYIWLKCPIDGHSWKKKPNDITTSWNRYGSSGCPICAGKTKKSEKQPNLTEAYPEFVSQYWNYEKNDEINLDPKKLTLGSNKKAWFRCPKDNNLWQASIAATVNQQWSKGNAGCRVCNGTESRKRGGASRK